MPSQPHCCTRAVGLRIGLASRLEPFATVTPEAVRIPCANVDCTNSSAIVITALSRANTTDSLEIAAAHLANKLKKSEPLSRRISRCFRTFSASSTTPSVNGAHQTIFSVTQGNMTTVVGEGIAMQGEKAKLVKGYRVSLLDWGKGRNKTKSEEQCGRGPEDGGGNGSGAATGATDPGQKATTTSTTANSNTITKSNTDSSPPANDTANSSSPPIQPTPRNSKGKSPPLRRSSSSGSNSDSTFTSSISSSPSFNYGPPEFEDANSKEEEPIIPEPEVFGSTRLAQVPVAELVKQMSRERGDIMGAFIPTVAQCAAHLELLGCFSKLRAKVEGSEEIGRWLFEIGHDAEGESDAGDIKWRAFVGKAVERFHMWWINFPEVVKNLPEPVDEKFESTPAKKQEDRNPFFRQWNRKPAKSGVMDIFAGSQKNDFGSGISFRKMTAETLPPLDVLLVWHAYTLNPHAFYEDCIRLNRLELWGMPLPWDLIHNAIDNYGFTFTLPSTAARFFTRITGQPADLYQSLVGTREMSAGSSSIGDPQEPPQKELLCPWCEKPFNVPLAEWHRAGDVGNYNGACGNCERVYEKEVVSVSMFLRDVHQFFLIEKEREREKGTGDESTRDATSKTLGFMFRGGVLHPPTGHYIPSGHPTTLNHIFSSPTLLTGVLLSAFPQLHPTTDNDPLPDIPSLLTTFPNTSTLLSHLSNHIQLVNNPGDTISPIPLLTRLFTNIVSTYKYLPPPPTSIPASTDLGAAVLRQGVFIKRIHDDARHIRSPALVGTIKRSRGRYDKFFRLIGKYQGKIFVPTNEIDLVWHTQQCYPALYYLYSNIVTANAGVGGGGRYIDHNDRLGEGILGNGFEETKRIWRVEYYDVGRDMRKGEIPLGRWWVLKGKKLGGRKAEPGQIDITRAKKSNNDGDVAEGPSIAAVTSVTPTGKEPQQNLGEDEGPSSSPAEDPEDWDDGKYAICCCWKCEMRRDMQEKEAGRGKYRKWGTKGMKQVGFTRQKEWKLRATVHYYRAVEAARNEGRTLPVWLVREP